MITAASIFLLSYVHAFDEGFGNQYLNAFKQLRRRMDTKDIPEPVWRFSYTCDEIVKETECWMFSSPTCEEGWDVKKSDSCNIFGQKLTCVLPITQPCPCGQVCVAEDFYREALNICHADISGKGIERVMDCTIDSVFKLRKDWDDVRPTSPLDYAGVISGMGFGTQGISFVVKDLNDNKLFEHSVHVEGEEWDLDHRTIIGSGGKQIAALIVLRAISDGHLNLWDTPEEILGWRTTTKDGKPNGATATLDQLFSFTSGIKGVGLGGDLASEDGIKEVLTNMAAYFFGNYLPTWAFPDNSCATLQNCVNRNQEVEASCEPGKCFDYELANGGLSVAAAMAEVATGKKFNDLLKEFARDLGHSAEELQYSCMATHMCNYDNPSVAGGLYINTNEYIDFMSVMANFGTFKGKRLIEKHLIQRMTFTPYLDGQLHVNGLDAAKGKDEYNPSFPSEGFYGFGTFLYCEKHLEYIDFEDRTMRCPIFGHGGIWGTGATVNLNNNWYAYYHTRDNAAEAGPMFQMFEWMINEITSKQLDACYEKGVEFTGSVVGSGDDVVMSPAMCQNACQKKDKCTHWRYSEVAAPRIKSECSLLGNVSETTKKPSSTRPGKDLIVSGPKFCPKKFTLNPSSEDVSLFQLTGSKLIDRLTWNVEFGGDLIF